MGAAVPCSAHGAGFVHRDIRWPNIVQVQKEFGIYQRSGFVLIDMEHAGKCLWLGYGSRVHVGSGALTVLGRQH